MDLLLQASAFVRAYEYTWPEHHLAYRPGNFTALPHTFNLSMLADVSADERYRVENAVALPHRARSSTAPSAPKLG